MNEYRISAADVKRKLRTVSFSDGDNVENRYVQAFCRMLADRLDRFFFEEWITPQTFVEEYFNALKSLLEQPAMEDMVASALGNVANAIFPPRFADQAKQNAVMYVVESGMFREEPLRGAWMQ